MISAAPRYRSSFATAVFDLLNPIPYGLFVGTLIFDIIYRHHRQCVLGERRGVARDSRRYSSRSFRG